jgi:arsenate reductase
LTEERKAAVVDAASAAAVMLESPSIVKRPVLQIDDAVHVGFADAEYQQFFKK